MDMKKFMWGLFATTSILTGMHLKSSQEFEYGKYIPFIDASTQLGPILCALGWILFALAIATKSTSNNLLNLHTSGYAFLAIFAIGLIYTMTQLMNNYQTCDATKDSECPDYIITGYAGGWMLLILSLVIQSKYKWINTFLAVFAATTIMLAKLIILPTQRLQQKVDGPGYTLITTGLFALTLANSL